MLFSRSENGPGGPRLRPRGRPGRPFRQPRNHREGHGRRPRRGRGRLGHPQGRARSAEEARRGDRAARQDLRAAGDRDPDRHRGPVPEPGPDPPPRLFVLDAQALRDQALRGHARGARAVRQARRSGPRLQHPRPHDRVRLHRRFAVVREDREGRPREAGWRGRRRIRREHRPLPAGCAAGAARGPCARRRGLARGVLAHAEAAPAARHAEVILRTKPSNRLQHRIVVFFVVLLMAVQLASFLAIRYAIERTAQNSLRDEMRVGARVFKRLLDQNSQQLVEATSVLTYDFGFREAIATRDRDTITSALRNHAARIKASAMSVIGLDGNYVADTHDESNAGKPYANPDMVKRALQLGRTSGIRMMGARPYQVVVVPVLAPLPIAWVSMTFVIDDNTARDLQRLSSSDVTFVRVGGEKPELLATTLPPSRRTDLLAQVRTIIGYGRDGMSTHLGQEEFEVLATPLEDTGDLRIYALLQRSVAEGHAPYLALQAVLMFLAAFALAITLYGSIRIPRRIPRPLSQLT